MAKTSRRKRSKWRKKQIDIYNKKYPKGTPEDELYGGDLIDLNKSWMFRRFKEGGKVMKYSKGGKIDGVALRGKTRGRSI